MPHSMSSDIGRTRTLIALGDLKLDLLAFGERLESAGLDGTEVHEDVLAAVLGRDEAEPLGLVEPFDGALHFAGHVCGSCGCGCFCGEV